MSNIFLKNDLTLETFWRAIVLIGKNNKTYKFALAKSLIQLAQENKQNITIRDLSPYFAKNILEHLKLGTAQGVDDNKVGPFLTACKNFLNGEISEDQLYQITEKDAFRDVIDRFHTVNQSKTDKTFYDDSVFKTEKRIIIKDEVFKLLEGEHGSSLIHEIESRWNLVEHAWKLKIPPALLNVEYDEETKLFYINKNSEGKTRRIDVTSSRSALNGYQKGHCFYCFDIISVESKDSNVCHVDHFFPHTLFDRVQNNVNYNGVWNLVLACSSCNSSKNAQVPSQTHLVRLHTRNEYYSTSHLPLKESILKTGATEVERKRFLQSRYDEARQSLISEFKVEAKREQPF